MFGRVSYLAHYLKNFKHYRTEISDQTIRSPGRLVASDDGDILAEEKLTLSFLEFASGVS
jgi:hypothetical protein